LKLDLHNHTWYSPDSITSPKQFIHYSKRKGVVLGVTEHGNANSWKALEKESKYFKWPFVRGQEQRVYWDKDFAGELIGLFLEVPLRSNQVGEVIDEIRSQDGVVMIPHPFDNRHPGHSPHFRNLSHMMHQVDLVEVFNAHTRHAHRTELAQQLAIRHHKPFSVGTDAHLPWEISHCHLEVDAQTLEEAREKILKNQSVPSIRKVHALNLWASRFLRLSPLRRIVVPKHK